MSGDNFTAATVPRKLSKLKEKAFATVSYLWCAVAFVWVLVSFIIVIPVLLFSLGLIGNCIIVGILLFWWSVGFIWFRDTHKMDATLLFLNFTSRAIREKNIIAKYKLPVELLKEIIPIEAVHDHGLIQFTENRYGVLLRIDAPRVSDNNLAAHNTKMENLVNSLYGDQMVKTYTACKNHKDNGLRDSLITRMNEDISQRSKEHLNSIYQHIEKTNTTTNIWITWMLVMMGLFDSVDAAELRRQVYVPGLIRGHLQKADIRCTVVEGNDVVREYRQMIDSQEIGW